MEKDERNTNEALAVLEDTSDGKNYSSLGNFRRDSHFVGLTSTTIVVNKS